MIAIEADGLIKMYNARRVVDDLTFTLRRGEVLGLLGPNGAGKTTTVNMLCGLAALDGGQAQIMGHDVVREALQVRRHIGVAFQEISLYESLTAWENLVFHARLYQVPRRQIEQRASEALQLAQLTAQKDSRVSTFSGGMKRRLVLARTLLHQPTIIFLDEPTLGIDVQARNLIWQQIHLLRTENRAVLLCTNYMEEADALCDRVVIIDQGRLIAVDTPQALKKRLSGNIVDLTVSQLPDRVEECLAALGASDLTIQAKNDLYDLSLRLEGGEQTLSELIDLFSRAGRIFSITAREPSMNDVFLALTGRALRD
jgi:ABC-2 type transport system ATP-binding protein